MKNEIKIGELLRQRGFKADDFGQFIYEENGVKIQFYHGTEWEIDITLPNGQTISIDSGLPFPEESRCAEDFSPTY